MLRNTNTESYWPVLLFLGAAVFSAEVDRYIERGYGGTPEDGIRSKDGCSAAAPYLLDLLGFCRLYSPPFERVLGHS